MNKAIITIFLFCGFCSCQSKKHNRLSQASSPYLQEHATNPVDWYEWGDEALEKAKKENKPLLISIGYSSCHWCHVMAKESFMDTGVARIMNENFVCIKVDREERPDIDNIYTSACQLIAGRSGWPLNAFALPDGKPFFAGTYYGRQSWINLLNQISSAYKTQNNKVQLQAQSLSKGIADQELNLLADTKVDFFNKRPYQSLFEILYSKMDLSQGGLKGTPKFPSPTTIEFLFQYYYLTKDEKALNAALTALTRMSLGGIYDKVRGGFARYAVDSMWRVPHFEKMLYDNAQLLSLYAYAYQLTGDDFFKRVMQSTALFTFKDLRAPDGGYYSSLNADTKEGEGIYYTWTAAEVKKILGNRYDLFAAYYNISEEGNWRGGRNILYASMTPGEFMRKIPQFKDISANLEAGKLLLLDESDKREKPSADDKVLTSWNALLLKGLLDVHAASHSDSYLQDALSLAHFLESKMIQPNGKLWRNYKDGKVSTEGFLDDYAYLAKAFIRLYQITFNKHWLDLASQITSYAVDNFFDTHTLMFNYTENKPGETPIRKLEISDDALPSSNAVMAEVLNSLGVYFEQSNYIDISVKMFSRINGQLQSGNVNFFASWCYLAGIYAYGGNEIAIVGKDALQKNKELQRSYLPFALFMGSTTSENLPLLEGKKKDDQTLIYVCTNRTCKRPVTEPSEALDQLRK